VVFRLVARITSEASAFAFAIYLGIFLFGSPEYKPPLELAMNRTFIFCGICAGYWWLQSGSLALSGVTSALRMATDVLTSLVPILVVSYAIIDFWRGNLPLSDFKQYASYYALSIVFLDVTFNAIIMARLSRRYFGEVSG
jgi:hypothetical protein